MAKVDIKAYDRFIQLRLFTRRYFKVRPILFMRIGPT